jgi:hypothetical protein
VTRRNAIWSLAFLLVGAFTLAGALFDTESQRTWALVSTLILVGVAVLLGLYLLLGWLSRVSERTYARLPRFLRRRR